MLQVSSYNIQTGITFLLFSPHFVLIHSLKRGPHFYYCVGLRNCQVGKLSTSHEHSLSLDLPLCFPYCYNRELPLLLPKVLAWPQLWRQVISNLLEDTGPCLPSLFGLLFQFQHHHLHFSRAYAQIFEKYSKVIRKLHLTVHIIFLSFHFIWHFGRFKHHQPYHLSPSSSFPVLHDIISCLIIYLPLFFIVSFAESSYNDGYDRWWW